MDITQDLKFKGNLVLKKSRLVIIVENLISNAIKYQDKDEKKSIVKIFAHKKKNQFVFQVEDNGLGVPKDKQSSLFKMFARFHTKVSFGSGLGLYTIKKSAEILDGTVTFEDPGKGTRFILTIPLAPDA